ncbi:mutator type transposase [Tanacetum coccineum]
MIPLLRPVLFGSTIELAVPLAEHISRVSHFSFASEAFSLNASRTSLLGSVTDDLSSSTGNILVGWDTSSSTSVVSFFTVTNSPSKDKKKDMWDFVGIEPSGRDGEGEKKKHVAWARGRLKSSIIKYRISFDLNEPKDSSKTDKAAENGRTPKSLTLKIHHGGCFTPIPSRSYAGGQEFDERMGTVECADDPFEDLDEILGDYANTRKQITRDEIIGKQMVVHVGVGPVRKFKEVEVDADNESEEESDTEGDYTSGSDSEDSDYDPKHDEVFDDDEHIVEDVHASMNNFSFTADPKHDLSIGVVEVHEYDLDVIDYDSFGSDLDDGIDSERRIQLRELRRIGKQKKQGRKLIMAKNDKERVRVRCEGTILALVPYAATQTDIGPWPGQILTAVGVDANNGIYPVAYAIVEAESKASWYWFLKLLGEDLGIEANFNFTFISDRQKPLQVCFQVLNTAKATSVGEFNKKMVELKSFNSDVYDWLMKIIAEQWSRAHFSGRAKCDLLLNNICEVFNRQLVDGRDQPIITCLEYIKEYLIKRIVLVQKVIAKTVGPLTPFVTKLFDAIKKRLLSTLFNGMEVFLYQLTGPYKDQCVVNMETRLCSCRKWELIVIPCKHDVAAIYNMSKNLVGVAIPEQWVHASYRLETWAHVYSFKVNPCNGREMWSVVESRIVIIPPMYKPQVSRPPKKRKKSRDEIANESCSSGKLSRKGKSVRCGKCGNVGHNRKGCRGQGGATQVGGSSARNVSAQATGARNVSSQSGGSSQPITSQSTTTDARNASSHAAGASQPSATPSTTSQGPT